MDFDIKDRKKLAVDLWGSICMEKNKDSTKILHRTV